MRVSVCIATYNGARHLAEQVGSILLQLGPDDELIAVDDGSSDETVEWLRRLGDARVSVHVNACNLGPARSFEAALSMAKGEIVFLSDQDDVWLPGRVSAMVETLDDADLVVSDCRVVNDALQEIHPSFFALHHSRPGLLRNLARNGFLGCCIALRRGLLDIALPFPESVPMHDWWLGLVAETFGRTAFLPQPLLLYRRHAANVSTTSKSSTSTWSTRLWWRASLAVALLRRIARRRILSGCNRHPPGEGPW